MDFDALYDTATPAMRDSLRQFRAQYLAKHIRVNDIEWEFLMGGKGGAVILWLVGGLRVADAAFRSIPILADSFHIIAPTYPAVKTMAELADGLAGILDAERIDRAHVLAGSFGGMVAQVFVRRHPQRVDKLILSTTTTPNPDVAQRYRKEMTMFADLPDELVREGAKMRFYEIIAPPPAEEGFWRAYFNELFSYRLSKEDLLSTYHCMVDYMEHYQFMADDLAGWPGNILILDSADDATFDETSRESVRKLYPAAQIYTFSSGGHSPASTQRDAYFQLVRQFLLR